jgi:hypothetical protein
MVKEKTCQDLASGVSAPAAAKACKDGEVLAADECAIKCNVEADRCPGGKRCAVARFRGAGGGFVTASICQ